MSAGRCQQQGWGRGQRKCRSEWSIMRSLLSNGNSAKYAAKPRLIQLTKLPTWAACVVSLGDNTQTYKHRGLQLILRWASQETTTLYNTRWRLKSNRLSSKSCTHVLVQSELNTQDRKNVVKSVFKEIVRTAWWTKCWLRLLFVISPLTLLIWRSAWIIPSVGETGYYTS